jgi:hypothetical protein
VATGEPSISKITHLFPMYPVLTGSTSPALDASSWTVDTGATSHVTGERSSITSDYTAYAPGEHQVKMANGTVVDAIGIGTAAIQAGEITIVLQQVLYIPACGKNQLIRVNPLLLKGATLTLDMANGTMIGRGNVHIVTAPTTEGLFVLKSTVASKPTANTTMPVPKRTSRILSGANLATVTKDRTAMRGQMAGARDTQMEGARNSQMEGARSTQLRENSARGTQNTGARSILIAGARCTQKAGTKSTQIASARCTLVDDNESARGTEMEGACSTQVGDDSARGTQNAGARSIQIAGARSTQVEDSARCTQNAGARSTHTRALMAAMSSEIGSLVEHHGFEFIAKTLTARGAKQHRWKQRHVTTTV